MYIKWWGEITYPFPNFNGVAVEVWERINNFTPHFIMDIIDYPWHELNHVSKRGRSSPCRYIQNSQIIHAWNFYNCMIMWQIVSPCFDAMPNLNPRQLASWWQRRGHLNLGETCIKWMEIGIFMNSDEMNETDAICPIEFTHGFLVLSLAVALRW